MLTEIELDAAVEAGVIGEHQAIALRNFQANREQAPLASLEKFQLFGGLADLMQAGALVLVFVGVWTLLAAGGGSDVVILVPLFPPILYAIGARLVSPGTPATSLVIAVAFLLASLFSLLCLVVAVDGTIGRPEPWLYLTTLVPPLVAGTVVFWRRFRFPPTFAIALTMAAFVATLACDDLARWYPETYDYLVLNLVLLLPAVLTLISALWWDLTDVRRETYRSQVAFWLHCLSGSLIARCAFAMLLGKPPVSEGFFFSGLGPHDFPVVIAIIACAAAISLLIDRRSLIVGAILPTVMLFDGLGDGESGVAFGLLFAGGCLFMFTRAWVPLRSRLVGSLPRTLAAQLPRTNLAQHGHRPTRRHRDLQPDATA
ncbi:MAG TPA: hypothetical protein VI168_08795 [Croceibacterium sp.]